MSRVGIPWDEGRWSREPASVERDGGDLLVEAIEGSDWWRTTLYGFVHDDGHALLAVWPEDAAVEVSVDLSGLTELYDQAGLLIRAGPGHWIKAGVEVNDGVPHLAAVVTDGRSDWSLAPVPEWGGEVVTIRASRSGDAVVLRARSASSAWRTLRVAPFAAAGALAGPMCCAPSRAGLRVRFTGWSLAAPDAGLHEDPPIA